MLGESSGTHESFYQSEVRLVHPTYSQDKESTYHSKNQVTLSCH